MNHEEIKKVINKLKMRIVKNKASRYIYLSKKESNTLIEFLENQNNEIENIRAKNEMLEKTNEILRKEYDIMKKKIDK